MQAQVTIIGDGQLVVDLADPDALPSAWDHVNANPNVPFDMHLTNSDPNPGADDPLDFGDSPLPPLSGNVRIFPGEGVEPGASFSAGNNTNPVFITEDQALLELINLGVGPSDAGGVRINPGGRFLGRNVDFWGNTTPGSGAGLNCGPGSDCTCTDCRFEEGHATQNGGAFHCGNDATCTFTRPVFKNNGADVWGCNGDSQGGNVLIRGGASSQDGPFCNNVNGEFPDGPRDFLDGYDQTDEGHDSLDCTSDCRHGNSVFDDVLRGTPGVQKAVTGDKDTIQSQCNDFGSGAISSLGFNIDSDGSCFLNQATDLPNTDPMIVVDENGIPQPQPGSPVIESGPVDFVNNELPCLYKDLNGLGRPQDFDLDGVFTCDRGPVEVQGGPDIGAPQSAAFYDTGRNGEGVFVEILANGMAVISFYTYSPDGMNMVWFVGLGHVVGNSVVVDELQMVTGGVFGAGFDPEKIIRTRVGGMSLVFPDCDAMDSPGILNFTAEPDSGFENLLQKAFRLTSIFNCDGAVPAANAHRSGAFYAPDRSGEGIFVQWLSDGRVVIVFYTFDSDGNPFWLTSVVDGSLVDDNTVTADMLYAGGKTKFGASFDPAEVDLLPWGTITLTYTDDNNLSFTYDSSVAGFGAGGYAYTRLTKLLGTD